MLRVSVVPSPLTPDLIGATVSDDRQHLGVAWDTDRERAICRALGEARERRWARSAPNTGTFEIIPLGDLNEQYSISGITQFVSLMGHPYSGYWPFIDKRAQLYSIPSTTGILIPAGLVWAGLPLGPNLPPFLDIGSNGLAFGTDVASALEHARWELFERDLAMRLHFGSVQTEPGLVPNTLSCLVESLKQSRVEVHCAFHGAHFAVAAITSQRADLPSASVASAARSGMVDATHAAILEALQVYHLMLQLMSTQRSRHANSLPSGPVERALCWAYNGASMWQRYVATEQRSTFATKEPSWEGLEFVTGEYEGAVVRAIAPGLGHLCPSDEYPLHISNWADPSASVHR